MQFIYVASSAGLIFLNTFGLGLVRRRVASPTWSSTLYKNPFAAGDYIKHASESRHLISFAEVDLLTVAHKCNPKI